MGDLFGMYPSFFLLKKAFTYKFLEIYTLWFIYKVVRIIEYSDYNVFGSTLLNKICNNHIFWEWTFNLFSASPERMFSPSYPRGLFLEAYNIR